MNVNSSYMHNSRKKTKQLMQSIDQKKNSTWLFKINLIFKHFSCDDKFSKLICD